MWPYGLVHTIVLARESGQVFLGKTTWFGIPDLCNGEEGLMGHGVDVHRVRDGNDV